LLRTLTSVDAGRDTAVHTASVREAAPPTRAGRLEFAYDALKRSLLAGEFALGQRLAEERLAARLGVSRTPVRESLARLHAEHLVDRHSDGGFTPRPPDMHATRHLYEVRFALECAALSRPLDSGEPHDPEEIARLTADWEALVDTADDPDPSFVLLDEDFHVRLAAASGNGELAQLLAHINDRIRPVRVHDFLSGERISATIAQHLAVLRWVRLGELREARAELDQHFAESLVEVETRAASALARMVANMGTR
jgi:DNA-binding GntR family transcriptional regulator